jgi:hypothetical protein
VIFFIICPSEKTDRLREFMVHLPNSFFKGDILAWRRILQTQVAAIDLNAHQIPASQI